MSSNDQEEVVTSAGVKQEHNVTIDGLQLPGFPKENLLEALNFKPRSDDVLIVTYPRTGTTWTQQIVDYILFYGNYDGSYAEMMLKSPYIEMTGTKHLESVTSQRVIKTHLPFRESLWNPKSKYILVVRNPMDTCVSQYHYFEEKGSIDTFAVKFMSGNVAYNSYKDFVMGWWPHWNKANVLLLVYEQMKSDLAGHIRKIGTFLGGDAATLVADDQIVEEIRSKTDISHMKEKINSTYVSLPKDEIGEKFREAFSGSLDFHRFFTGGDSGNHLMVRQGALQQWKNELSPRTQRLFKLWLTSDPRFYKIMRTIFASSIDLL